MTVRELNRDQLAELKINYLVDLGNDLSYEDLVNIHDLVSDKEVFDAYSGVYFTPDDFSSSAGHDDWWVKLSIDGELKGTRDGIADDLNQIAEWVRGRNNGGFFYKGISWEITE